MVESKGLKENIKDRKKNKSVVSSDTSIGSFNPMKGKSRSHFKNCSVLLAIVSILFFRRLQLTGKTKCTNQPIASYWTLYDIFRSHIFCSSCLKSLKFSTQTFIFNPDISTVAVPGGSPSSFWCEETKLELAPSGMGIVHLEFLPLSPGIRSCAVLFSCPGIGEFLQVGISLFHQTFNLFGHYSLIRFCVRGYNWASVNY